MRSCWNGWGANINSCKSSCPEQRAAFGVRGPVRALVRRDPALRDVVGKRRRVAALQNSSRAGRNYFCKDSSLIIHWRLGLRQNGLQTRKDLFGRNGRKAVIGALADAQVAVARAGASRQNPMTLTDGRPPGGGTWPEQGNGRHTQTGSEMQRAGVAGNENTGARQHRQKPRQFRHGRQNRRVRRAPFQLGHQRLFAFALRRGEDDVESGRGEQAV